MHGKALAREDIRKDITTIKQFNFNCIRLSHYPSDPYLLDLCDEYGIMVIDEANHETHGLGGKLDHDPQWTAAYIERVSRMALRDKNHPSIIMWSLGNEAGSGPNHAAMAGWIKDFDMTRPLHYEPAMGSPKEEGYINPSDPRYLKSNDHSHRIQNPLDQYYVDVVSRMYPSDYTAPLLANQQNGDHRPIFFCEYAHAMGNSAGNLKDFWDQWRATPRIIGGCIWEFKDQGLLKKDSAGVEYYAYGGDYGEKYFDNFTIKGIVTADGRPKQAMYECKRIFQPIDWEWVDSLKGLVRITNKSQVLNLNKYNFSVMVQEDGKSILGRTWDNIQLEPGTDTVFNISLWLRDASFWIPMMSPYKEYHILFSFTLKEDLPWAKKGFEIASVQLGLKKPKKQSSEISHKAGYKVDNNDTAVLIRAVDFSAVVKRTGMGGLSSLIYKGKETLLQPLVPDFTRPLTDNDRRGWKPQRKLRQWYESGMKLINTRTGESEDQEAQVINEYSLINDSATVIVTYTFSGSGVIKVGYELNVKPGLPNIPKVGMQLGTAPSNQQITYFGRGPMENYTDRNYGTDIGLYQQDIHDFADSYVVPQEYANRTDVRWMSLRDPAKGNGLLVVADSLLSMSAWPYTEENIGNAKHTNKLVKAPYITLNIDLVQMGVGGNDSWSEVAAPLEKYQVKAKDYHYSFFLVPLAGKNTNPAEMARIIKRLY